MESSSPLVLLLQRRREKKEHSLQGTMQDYNRICSKSPDGREILISIACLGHQHRHPSETVQYLIKWLLLYTFVHLRTQFSTITLTLTLTHPIPINQCRTLNEKLLSKQILNKSQKQQFGVVLSDTGYLKCTRRLKNNRFYSICHNKCIRLVK